MRIFFVAVLCYFISINAYAQPTVKASNLTGTPAGKENIYEIKQQYLYNVLHNPAERNDGDDDNDLERFNRWFHDVEVRCYPTGDMPRPDVLLRATQDAKKAAKTAHKTTTGSWQPVGPTKVPINTNGIGRINCIVVNPRDTNTLYIGAACGGVFISHDGGGTWTTNSDQFPSLSIADIAVDPQHPDTIYAATGDGYGYEDGSANIFWGGLYSAGVMKSTDGGNTWDTTGLSYLQLNKDIIQRLLICPTNPSVLLAATRNGIFRTTDGGATWAFVEGGHVYSMQFRPFSPDTVYAINDYDLRVSYDTGATWHTLKPGMNPLPNRATIAVSPAAPNDIWVLDAQNQLHHSHTAGQSFTTTTSPNDTASFYGYYDRVLTASPADSNNVVACGLIIANSTDAGMTWNRLDIDGEVHVDNHALTFNPANARTIYSGNDGGICVTHDGGRSWKNLANGLMISQIYRMSSSQQSPYRMICGLQDNGTFGYNGTSWLHKTGGDGMDCAIHPTNDNIQISSYQNGNFFISHNQGGTFDYMPVCSEAADWTAPVVFDPQNELTFYVGYQNIYGTYNQGGSFVKLTTTTPFSTGAKSMAVAPSNSNVIYAADYTHILRTTDGGITWTNVTGTLPAGVSAITHIAVDYRDPMHIYVTTSGYTAANKVFSSTTGGSTWTNLSSGLPNIPADCVAVDSSNPGAVYVGTDLGVYYTDSLHPGWAVYGTGLPNVIAANIHINYGNHKVRVATYGRGIWENDLVVPPPPVVSGIKNINGIAPGIEVAPNPTTGSWKLTFGIRKPANYTVNVLDGAGRVVRSLKNTDVIDASALPDGDYNIEVLSGDQRFVVKAVKG